MTRARSTLLRAVVGVTLMAHGLGSATLPLRGADWLAPGSWHPLLTAACVVTVVGFVAAGAGVLGVRPFNRWPLPLALAAAAGFVVAQSQLPDRDGLAVGWILSVILPLAVALLPGPPRDHHRWWGRGARDVCGVAFVAWVALASGFWPVSRTWGASAEDWRRALPGDHQPRTPQFEILHVVSIAAPPERVWERLVQLGQDRAGFYSYDWLERAFGADIRNSDEVRPEWQQRAAGDRVFATQAGYLGGAFGARPGWRVALAEPNRALVLEQWGAFVLVPDGPNTRLLVRSTISNARIPALAAAINWAAFEMPHFIMQRGMLTRIKALAEGRS